MKKQVIIGCLLASILGRSSTNAQMTPNTIENFDVTTAVENIKDLQSSVTAITKELFALDDKERQGGSGAVSAQFKETRAEIVNIINTITNTTSKVGTIIKQLAGYKQEIKDSNETLKSVRSGMGNSKEDMENFIQLLYKVENKLYTEEDTGVDLIKLIANSNNLPITLASDQMLQTTMKQFTSLRENLNNDQTQELDNMKKFSKLKNDAEAELVQYENQLEQLQQKKNYLIQFLGLYKKDKFERQQTISQLFESTKGVNDKIGDLLKETKKGVYKVDFDMNSKLKDLEDIAQDDDMYPVAWPIYPIYEIQTYFGDLSFQKQYGIPQLGIQIKADQNTPVYAARDGIVYFVADNDNIGINRAMIVHTDGYVTVYQYLNRSVVKPGDIVRRGQLIGYSGGEPGTRGAGFISKGANITFMVFKDTMPIDPFDMLDASIVQDKSVLPEGYQIKYLRDKYARPIDITTLKIMSGSTLEERESQFLRAYGVGVYKLPAFWEDAAKGTNIDKDVVICIAFAESTLGRYLSTSNNIGNVGNNDRGDRVAINSVLAGARAIPLTLNNGYLGDYHTINQLSRYGNKDGKIYASSPINWQTNVLKCLSQIKGYYIPEDFPFRVGENPNKATTNGEYVAKDSLTLVKSGTN
ncbi:MAG: peptidoglycan DD-metalloendopeptidase family protein [Candidatus Absconditabacteria bacterium]